MGIMGVHQTAPAFATFTVKPKVATLKHAAITVPTIRGFVKVRPHVQCRSVWSLDNVTMPPIPEASLSAHNSPHTPTPDGCMQVTAGPGILDVSVPCGSRATLCMPRAASDARHAHDPVPMRLVMDGNEVQSVVSGGHLCAAEPVGCGAAGAPRQLRISFR